MTNVVTQANHFDDGKIQFQWLLAMPGLAEVAKVGMYGAKKYGQNNWRGGSDFMRYIGSILRHVTQFLSGENNDVESGLPHLAHAAYNCLIILSWQITGKGTDDRPTETPKSPSDLSF